MSRLRFPTPSRPHRSSYGLLHSVEEASTKGNSEGPGKTPTKILDVTDSFSYPDYTWTDEDKKMLRTLKSDEKSRFSWRVVASKMGKPERDVRAMWNKIKDQLG